MLKKQAAAAPFAGSAPGLGGSEHGPGAELSPGAGTAPRRVGARSQRGPDDLASLSKHLL